MDSNPTDTDRFEALPTQEGHRRATRFWSDDYRHGGPLKGESRVPKRKTLRTHRKGR